MASIDGKCNNAGAIKSTKPVVAGVVSEGSYNFSGMCPPPFWSLKLFLKRTSAGHRALMPSKRSTRDEVQIHQDANRQAPVLFVGNPLPMRIYDVGTLRFLEANESATPVLAAVNVSPLQLMRSDFVAEVREAISQSGIDPIWLEMEITERVALNFDEIAKRMEHLAEMGLRFAADDFGTAYSSFQHLDPLRSPHSRLTALLSNSSLKQVAAIPSCKQSLRWGTVYRCR